MFRIALTLLVALAFDAFAQTAAPSPETFRYKKKS